MDSFDDQYILLEELYEDSFYPDFLIDKIKYLLEDFINFVEYDNIARECLIRNLEYIIKWFHLPINLEEALAEREWD